MMRYSTLVKNPADWMGAGTEPQSPVLTSRIRLARNINGQPFPGWTVQKQRTELWDTINAAVCELSVMKKGFSTELGKLSQIEKQLLVERHLISREHAARNKGSGVIIERGQAFSFMVNEEDHLRMQAIRPGLQLKEAHAALQHLDDELEQRLDYAYDDQLGYLTACPSNLGTGMRASAMLHLPALVLNQSIGQVLSAVGNLGLAVRGLYGEGTDSLGNLFQISNQSTLGESEHEIIARLERVISDIARQERYARENLFEKEPNQIADSIGRAYGTLRYARQLESKEALGLISLLRLGGAMSLLDSSVVGVCDILLMELQPAHLQWKAGKKMNGAERDIMRAELCREQLKSVTGSDILI